MLLKSRFFVAALLALGLNQTATAQVYTATDPLAHTYSIVARDPATGDMAVAVQSHWFSVGTAVSWGEAGVGVVATQSFTNKSFGTRGLALLKSGKTAQQALDELLATDEGRDVRQVAILDAKGNVATHTGKKCVDMAGHVKGSQFSVQANMMLNDKVWPAMAQAYEKNAKLPFAERVLSALEAAEAAGGDIRGGSRRPCWWYAAKPRPRPGTTGSSTCGWRTMPPRCPSWPACCALPAPTST
ncbi:DUF1028 domain-containing protein [Hymenobacter cellulosilyticus]|uniref:DUF1028 domain-containing protein n=1 Tax=Hymenobacter cellulosilyticus TaxID=2932248 RepID=UPI002880977E|nr:DUF1028 domain-containing protein [Hymenobacter cellulosilyticus]